MNLKENYERFFKDKLGNKPQIEKTKLDEKAKQRFSNLSKILSGKYPHAPMTLKEGFVWFGSKKVEKIETFLNKTSLQIQEEVRVFANSGKKGLL
jgi:hypothetical protein